jgi:hypothetical protein
MPLNPGRPGAVGALAVAGEDTRLESDEEIRQALRARRERLAARARKAPAVATGKRPVAEPVEAETERPVLRPPTALLCVLDDGGSDGEWLRLRADVTVIGRSEGTLCLPHDALVSGRHAELVRQQGPNGYRWLLVDLQSTNGTFLRILSTVLRPDNEMIIGGGHYRFEAPAPAPAANPSGAVPQTQPWSGAPAIRSLVPSLVELSSAGPVNRFPLTLPEYWIGRDARSCAIVRPDDVLVNARHARLHRDAKGQWRIENNKSLNGLWLRVAEPMPLGGACQFRVGEQRFLFRVT